MAGNLSREQLDLARRDTDPAIVIATATIPLRLHVVVSIDSRRVEESTLNNNEPYVVDLNQWLKHHVVPRNVTLVTWFNNRAYLQYHDGDDWKCRMRVRKDAGILHFKDLVEQGIATSSTGGIYHIPLREDIWGVVLAIGKCRFLFNFVRMPASRPKT